MNTIRSVGYGWGVLVVAGGGAYYFAKRSINAEKATRLADERKRRRLQEQLEFGEPASTSLGLKHRSDAPTEYTRRSEWAGSPSQEASEDPAPTRHAPENEGQKAQEKSKYEGSQVYRSKKGDRFS